MAHADGVGWQVVLGPLVVGDGDPDIVALQYRVLDVHLAARMDTEVISTVLTEGCIAAVALATRVILLLLLGLAVFKLD